MGKSSEAAAKGRHQVHCKRDEDRCIARPLCGCDLDSVECYPAQVILQHRQHLPEAGKPIRYFMNASAAKRAEQIVGMIREGDGRTMAVENGEWIMRDLPWDDP